MRCSAPGSTVFCLRPPKPITCIIPAMTGWKRCCGVRLRAEDPGATIDVVALAAVRATREAQVTRSRETLPSILGTPMSGETADGEGFDGNTEVATFPGELPADPQALFEGENAFRGLAGSEGDGTDFRF